MREANPCLCAIRNRDGKVIVGATGYVKVYRPLESPPPGGYIVIGHQSAAGYWLCRCPECQTVAGKRRNGQYSEAA